jgi:hypothetical protein
VHIARKHGTGNPAEFKVQAGGPFSFHPDKANKNREYSQRHPNNNRHTVGYKKTGRGNDDFGAMVDYMYRFLTYFEENLYKMGEIKKITDRQNSSMNPKWIHSMNFDPHAFANAFQGWLSEVMKNDHSSKQRDSEAAVAASSHQEIEKTPHDLFSRVDKDNTHQSSSSVHPVSSRDEGSTEEDGWIEEDGWRVKRDMFGDVIDAYRLHDTFF